MGELQYIASRELRWEVGKKSSVCATALMGRFWIVSTMRRRGQRPFFYAFDDSTRLHGPADVGSGHEKMYQ